MANRLPEAGPNGILPQPGSHPKPYPLYLLGNGDRARLGHSSSSSRGASGSELSSEAEPLRSRMSNALRSRRFASAACTSASSTGKDCCGLSGEVEPDGGCSRSNKKRPLSRPRSCVTRPGGAEKAA